VADRAALGLQSYAMGRDGKPRAEELQSLWIVGR
jgi:hypothetical protein